MSPRYAGNSAALRQLRRRLEAASHPELVAELVLYRGLVEHATEGIFQTTPEGRLLEANPALARIFGYDSAEEMITAVTDVARQLYARPEQRAEFLRLLSAQESVQDFQLEAQRKDGRRIWLSFNARVVRDPAGGIRGYQGSVQDISERKRLEGELLDISSNERRRVGHELHDGLGQYLAGIAFRAKALEQALAAEASPHAPRAGELSLLVSNAMRQARSVARGLDPVQVEQTGLAAALERLAAEVTQYGNAACRFRCLGTPPRVNAQAGLSLYRMAQEAIHNAIRHGQAQRIELELAVAPPYLQLRVQDNGLGFVVPAGKPSGMGLRIMEYRARALGARLSVDSEPKRGTQIRCQVPLALCLATHSGTPEPLTAPVGPSLTADYVIAPSDNSLTDSAQCSNVGKAV